MNWKKVSIERLKDFEVRKAACERIPEQIATLEMQYTAIRSAIPDEAAIKTGNENQRERALIENITKRSELKNNLDIAKREVEITEKGLKSLTEDQYKILDRFYISRMHGHVESLCEELCMEKSRIYELKNEALHRFTISCYGVVEV